MSAQFDIVGFGICTVDFLGLVAEYPEASQKVQMQAFSRQGGGLTGTALGAAAKLGANVAYLGKLGYDEHSRFLLDEFRKDGVDVQHTIRQHGTQPPLSFIHVQKCSGDRRITWFWKPFELKAVELNRSLVDNSRILFLDHFFIQAGIQAAQWIHTSGGCVVVDVERAEADFEDILRTADFIIASHKFALEQTGENDPEMGAKLLRQKYGGVVVVTAGERGAFCSSSSSSMYQPAFQVPVVDTTGAGDVFHGAFMAGLSRGWPLDKVLEFASAVAALKCRGLGGRAMIPNLPEALAFLKDRGNSTRWL
ncbi:MAG: carbohydrate kinase family protein [bacterium]